MTRDQTDILTLSLSDWMPACHYQAMIVRRSYTSHLTSHLQESQAQLTQRLGQCLDGVGLASWTILDAGLPFQQLIRSMEMQHESPRNVGKIRCILHLPSPVSSMPLYASDCKDVGTSARLLGLAQAMTMWCMTMWCTRLPQILSCHCVKHARTVHQLIVC